VGTVSGLPLIAAATDLPAVPSARLCVPVPLPRNLYARRQELPDHVRGFGRSGHDPPDRSTDAPRAPVVFAKVPSSVTGPYDDIDPRLGITSELDHEAEVAVITGRGGRGIHRDRDRALDHVWGYTVINDVTARDPQRDGQQWLIGKSLTMTPERTPGHPCVIVASGAGAPSCSATRSSARSNSTSPPGVPWARWIPNSPSGSASGSSANWRTTPPSGSAPTSPSSHSAAS
jgi:hypothetical protein